MSTYTVIMPYVGKSLSVNYYKIVGRGGLKTNCTKSVVKVWMQQLKAKVREVVEFPVLEPVTITLLGRFEDSRCPDLANLHKVIGDAIKEAIGVDDKYFNFEDKGFSTGHKRQELEIGIITGG